MKQFAEPDIPVRQTSACRTALKLSTVRTQRAETLRLFGMVIAAMPGRGEPADEPLLRAREPDHPGRDPMIHLVGAVEQVSESAHYRAPWAGMDDPSGAACPLRMLMLALLVGFAKQPVPDILNRRSKPSVS